MTYNRIKKNVIVFISDYQHKYSFVLFKIYVILVYKLFYICE